MSSVSANDGISTITFSVGYGINGDRIAGRRGSGRLVGRAAAGSLSGGQAQHVAIARALVAEPDVLVLDEPISSLDVSTRATLLNLLKDLARDRRLTMVFISHDRACVSYMADRIAILRDGRLGGGTGENERTDPPPGAGRHERAARRRGASVDAAPHTGIDVLDRLNRR